MTIDPCPTSVTFSGTSEEIADILALVSGTLEPDPEPIPVPTCRPLHFKTGPNAELCQWVMMTNGSGVWKFTPILSVHVGSLAAGSLIQFVADAEFTNTHVYTIMIAGFTVLTDSPTSVVGVEMDKRNGDNITTEMHHGKMHRLGTHVVTEDMPDAYVNVIAYAASTAAGPTHGLKVEQNYGDLSVLIWPPEGGTS